MRRSGPALAAAIGLAVVLAIALSGCGPLVTAYAGLSSNDGENDRTQYRPESDALLGEMARKFGLMALFAEVVYRRDIPEDVRDGQGCAYLESGKENSEAARFGMPGGGEGQGRWKRWIPPSNDERVRACIDVEGLYYETYVYENSAGALEEAVIAFRGTENRRGQYWYDWRSNFVAALGFEPRQYALAQERLQPLIEALRARFGQDGTQPRIYAVGHSLGGGLAQQAGYASEHIAEVFTFNTSPVTNWSHLRLRGEVRKAYPIFHRIYHGGEFLEKVRFVATSFTQARYGRHDIGLQLKDRKNFSGHSMRIIACTFAELVAERSDIAEADHHYPLAYIREMVLPPRAADASRDRQLICSESKASA